MPDFLSQREGDASKRDERRFTEAVEAAEAAKPKPRDPFALDRQSDAEARSTALHHAVTTRLPEDTPADVVKHANVYLEFLQGNPEVATHASEDPTD